MLSLTKRNLNRRPVLLKLYIFSKFLKEQFGKKFLLAIISLHKKNSLQINLIFFPWDYCSLSIVSNDA